MEVLPHVKHVKRHSHWLGFQGAMFAMLICSHQ